MTSKIAVVIAVSLIINGVRVLSKESILMNKYLPSNLVFLLSVCLVVREYVVLPSVLWKKFSAFCTILELPLSVVLLESSLCYIWSAVQEYVASHADALLVHLSEERGLGWLVCHMCCGQDNCADVFAGLMMKGISFVVLGVACLAVSNKRWT